MILYEAKVCLFKIFRWHIGYSSFIKKHFCYIEYVIVFKHTPIDWFKLHLKRTINCYNFTPKNIADFCTFHENGISLISGKVGLGFKADSHELHLTRAASADSCISAEIGIFLFIHTAHFCQSCTRQTQLVSMSLKLEQQKGHCRNRLIDIFTFISKFRHFDNHRVEWTCVKDC